MSRSYRKTPILKETGKKKKRTFANRKVRRKLNSDLDYTLANGKSYKKVFESWDITDYVTRLTLNEAIEDWYASVEQYPWFKKMYPTLDSYIKWWKVTYKSK